MLYSKQTEGAVEEVVAKVEHATKANGFGVIGGIDLKGKMVEKGVEFGPECSILEVCNPKQAKRVLEQNLAISTALPCRISVYEKDGKVEVATIRPTAMLDMFNEPGLDSVAREVEETIIKIIDQACG